MQQMSFLTHFAGPAFLKQEKKSTPWMSKTLYYNTICQSTLFSKISLENAKNGQLCLIGQIRKTVLL